MCSRYELNASAREVAARFRLTVPPPLPNRPELRPTDLGLVIGPEGGRLARWGLEVEWDKRPLINARAETLAGRPTFRRLLSSRVLVPATAWWEWRKRPDGGKTRMRLRPAAEIFALAGLLDGERFTLVTSAATGPCAEIHDRMPALLRPADEAGWLDPSRSFAEVAPMLEPCGDMVTVAPVEGAPDAAPPAQGSLF